MSEELLKKFVTNRYRILKLMHDNQVRMVDGSIFIPMTQAEIAKQLGLSLITINSIFKEMQADKLLYQYGIKRGRYCLTKKAILIVEQIESLSFILGREEDDKASKEQKEG